MGISWEAAKKRTPAKAGVPLLDELSSSLPHHIVIDQLSM
jgi:hypothetical protein